MKAYKITLLYLDSEDIDEDEIVEMIENVKHLYPSVMDIESREIGEWDDDHPLNKQSTSKEEFERLFSTSEESED